MKGKLFGVGVGPGDPELLTLKAVRLIKENNIVAVPGETKAESIAYKIVKKAIVEIESKEIIAIPMPMTKDEKKLSQSHQEGAETIIKYLENGENVVFLTLGDPTIYSTYMYIHGIVGYRGYETEIISGITSFCAASARLNESLVEKSEMLHIVPSSYGVEEALLLKGTKVLMKAGKKMNKVKEALQKKGCKITMVENCGMENEKIFRRPEEINNVGYYSLIIVKED